MEKYHIQANSVQETLVIPLYGRKLCSERFPALFKDDKAVELIDRLDYDFGDLEKRAQSTGYQFGALEVAMRQNDLSYEIKDYLTAHPQAAIVNLGCGLDQTAENCQGEQNRVYNIDFPDVIKARNVLIPPSGLVTNIAADLNDTSWFDSIDDTHGVVFVAAGVFYYFKTQAVRKLFCAMEKRFAGGRLCFDSAGKRAVKIMLKTWVKQAGVTSIKDYFALSDAVKELSPWFESAKVTSKGYMLGYNDLKDPSVPASFRLLARLGDGVMKMRIVKIDWESKRRAEDLGFEKSPNAKQTDA